MELAGDWASGIARTADTGSGNKLLRLDRLMGSPRLVAVEFATCNQSLPRVCPRTSAKGHIFSSLAGSSELARGS
jgi:hypothetical protein